MERGHLDEIGVDGRTIMIMDIQEVGGRSMEWSDLAHGRGRCRAFVNAERTFVFREFLD
jgi:hypothetical protein